jgi:hypothetical protein
LASGGRHIWQIENADRLLVAWRMAPTPAAARADEGALIARFRSLHHGRRPFANLTG